jgi:putative hydrolase of the HAD superfamily
MAITGIIFDLYGTLIDIETDESMEEIYRGIAHFLTYEGIYLHRGDVSSLYWQLLKQQKQDSNEKYPEINVEALWNSFLKQHGSRKRLQLYPDVQQVLEELKPNYRMGIVSDAQSCFALPEIKATGLAEYFDPVVISGSDGYRKPDPRLFEKALDLMKLKASQVIYVGNDMYRDIHGAQRAGIKTIFVNSNQGEKQYEDVKPDYFAHFFKDVSQGIASLA